LLRLRYNLYFNLLFLCFLWLGNIDRTRVLLILLVKVLYYSKFFLVSEGSLAFFTTLIGLDIINEKLITQWLLFQGNKGLRLGSNWVIWCLYRFNLCLNCLLLNNFLNLNLHWLLNLDILLKTLILNILFKLFFSFCFLLFNNVVTTCIYFVLGRIFHILYYIWGIFHSCIGLVIIRFCNLNLFVYYGLFFKIYFNFLFWFIEDLTSLLILKRRF
jgi:hypothetical protein